MLKILFFSLCLLSIGIQAKDDHGHDHEKEHKEKPKSKSSHDDHKDEHKDDKKEAHADHDDDHDEHGSDGFKLTAKAVKNFALTYVDYKAPGTTISSKAIFRSLSEVNIYRVRAGLYKRIDFKTLEKNKDTWKVNSPDLMPGDQIVVSGIGFLRIAEIAASGGLSDSHSH